MMDVQIDKLDRGDRPTHFLLGIVDEKEYEDGEKAFVSVWKKHVRRPRQVKKVLGVIAESRFEIGGLTNTCGGYPGVVRCCFRGETIT